jgi:hypothetical protein
MRKTLDLWILIAMVFISVAAVEAFGSGIASLKLARPFAVDYFVSSLLLLLGTCAAISGVWWVRRRGQLHAYTRELWKHLGWLMLVWAVVGWWSIAVDAGALGASLYTFPVMLVAGAILGFQRLK